MVWSCLDFFEIVVQQKLLKQVAMETFDRDKTVAFVGTLMKVE